MQDRLQESEAAQRLQRKGWRGTQDPPSGYLRQQEQLFPTCLPFDGTVPAGAKAKGCPT